MSTPARLHELIEPIVTGLGLELFDLHYSGSVLTVLVERPATGADAAGPGARPGVDLGAITAATRAISRALDEADPIAGHYSLEVSSPGLERPLRTPAHFTTAVGEIVTVKTVPGHDGPRRLRGELVQAPATGPDEPAIEVRDEGTGDVHRVPVAAIERARTVFVWGPEPKLTKPKPPKAGRRKGGGSAGAAPAPGEPASPAPSAGRRDDPPSNADDPDDKKVSAT